MNSMDSKAILRLDMGVCIGIILGPLLESLFRIHVLLAYETLLTIAHII